MDMSPGFHCIPATSRDEPPTDFAAELWAEHGWALKGRDVACILLAAVVLCAVLTVFS